MKFMDKFIEINLTEIGKKYEKLLDNQFSIILGSPGSGKSWLAKHLKEKFNGTFFSVKDFMEFCEKEIIEEINKNAKNSILLLDGFDEYRIFEVSKTDTSKKLARKVKKVMEAIDGLKIIMTCRELDWYGDNNKETLEKYLDLNVEIYYIESLDDEQIEEFSKLYNVENEEEFISKFKDKGFLSTPQLLRVSTELMNKNIDNKINLYEEFIEKAILEENNYHKERLHLSKKSNDELIEKLGYLAFFYMFSSIESFEEECLKKISSDKKGFEYEILEELVSNAKLFKNKTFIHRIFAEYLAAYFIFHYLIEKRKIPKEIIRGLFLNDNYVYTELRGTYAWLCSISMDEYFIDFDPFYQLLYGENNHFGIEFKKKILLSIKKYSKEINPYFINPEDFYLRGLLKGFYNEGLDDFIIDEIEEAIKMKNHYLYVFEFIIRDNIVSKKLKKFLFEKLYDNNLNYGFKVSVIYSQDFDVVKLKELLNALKENKVKDEDNRIQVAILNKIYPENVGIKEVVEIIGTFNETSVINTCDFLFKTPKEKEIELVELLEKKIMEYQRDNYSSKILCVKYFISNFYYELINGYNGKNAKKIYGILKQVRQYYKPWETIEVEPYNSKIEKLPDEKLNELANKIFKLYLEDILKEKNGNLLVKILNFEYFFSLKTPINIIDLCDEKMEKIDNEKLREELFKVILKFANKKNLERLDEVAKKYKMEKIFEEFKKQFFKIQEEIKQREKSKENEKREIIEKNEEYFREMEENDFLKDFKAISFISELIYFDKEIEDYISMETFEKLKEYLKGLIFIEFYDEYIDLENVFLEFNNIRYIDIDFIVSLYLNQDNIKEVLSKLSNEKLKYLYFLSIKEEKVANGVSNKNFIDRFEKEKEKLAKETLLEAIKTIDEKFYNTLKKYFEDSELSELKEFLNILNLSKDKNIDAFLKVYNFRIEKETLEELKKEYDSELLSIFYKFIYNEESLTKDELVKLYVSVYEYSNSSKIFNLLSKDERIRLVWNFLKEFDSEDKMPIHSGYQSNLDLTINFVRYKLIDFLSVDELKKLDNEDISEYWNKIIKRAIVKKSKEELDFDILEIKKLKQFVFESHPINEYQFFKKVEIELDYLIKRIERNETQEKDMFWEVQNDTERHILEEDSRNRLINLWKSNDLFTREALIEKYRADIEITEKKHNWKVRIECKLDKNPHLISSVKKQLIEKYLENREANYGIYLIFYFGDNKKEIKELKKEIEAQIPATWKEKVVVKLIDLRRHNKKDSKNEN